MSFHCSRWFVLLSLLFLGAADALATHIVGGEISYEDLGGGAYRVRLVVYRDCGPANQNGTGFDDAASVGIFNSNGLLVNVVNIPLSFQNVSEVPVALENPCGTPPPSVCVEQAVYEQVVDIGESPNGFTLSYQRCCRNPSIVNLNNPDDAGATFTTQIPGTNVTTADNSSPVFNSLPPVALCAGFDFFFDHSATDLDGDSLAYTFCSPLFGGTPNEPAPNPPNGPPYTAVNWAPGYSATYPLDSDPGLTIDPVTGFITGMPTAAGQYVIGICVEEWRDGQLLSTSNRDFQFNVTVCDPNISSLVANQSGDQLCIGETIEFQQFSINATFFFWDFGVEGIESDTSNLESPAYTFPEPGTYEVLLIANPGWPCADSSTSIYEVYAPVEPELVVTDFACPNGTPLYDFGTVDDYPDATFQWDFGGQASSDISDLEAPSGIGFPSPYDVQAELTVVQNGCIGSGVLDWTPPDAPQAAIAPQEDFCTGFSLSFDNNSTNALGYVWTFGEPGNDDVSYDAFPTWTYDGPGSYEVELIAQGDFHCPDTASTVFEVAWLLEPYFETPEPECFEEHSFNFEAIGVTDPNATFDWNYSPGAAAIEAGPVLQGLSFPAPGFYTVEVVVTAEGCERDFETEVEVLFDPSVAFDGGPVSGCPPLPVSFENFSQTETSASYTWYFGDGSTSNAPFPNHVYEVPGSYTVTLEMSTAGYCVQELATTQTAMIEVLPVPTAGFSIEPSLVDILEPLVQVEDLSVGAVQHYYNFGDGGSSTDASGPYVFQGAGAFDVTQTVINEYGCTATAQGQVGVNGTLFYAPNSFTPNNDGVNDFWRPTSTGLSAYKCSVYNRWGEVLFSTTDPEEGWYGNVKNGDHYAPNGVYLYEVYLEDQLRIPFTYSGQIQLFR